MNKNDRDIARFTMIAATMGIVIGGLIFILPSIVNAYNYNIAIGIGIIYASMHIFGFGTFLSLMVDYSKDEKTKKDEAVSE